MGNLTGFQGFTGAQGFTGHGYQGFTGFQGYTGYQGYQGKSGSFGGATFEYVADLASTSSADPGSTKFRLNQTDLNTSTKLYINETTNGLTYAVEKFKNEDLAGHVILQKGERSKVATLAAKLL